MTKRCCVLLTLAVILAASCHKPTEAERNAQALRTALERYLAGRSNVNLAAMDLEIKQVTIQGNHAEAQVEFRARQGGGSMQMMYAFERQGDEWVVSGSSATGSRTGHPEVGGDASETPPQRAPAPPAKKP